MNATRQRVLVSLAPAVLFCLVGGCGGGTEIAPPSPVVAGLGSASASLDGASFGSTQEVQADIGGSTQTPTDIVDEPVTFLGSDFARLAHGGLTGGAVVLRPTIGGPPWVLGADRPSCLADPTCDFWVDDPDAGILARNPGGAISAGGSGFASYTYLRALLKVNVAILYPAGRAIRITVFNVDSEATGPLTITTVAASAPAGGALGFNAELETNLTGLQHGLYATVNDATARLDVTSIDLSNQLNPCIAGHLVVHVTDTNDPNPNQATLDATFNDPDC